MNGYSAALPASAGTVNPETLHQALARLAVLAGNWEFLISPDDIILTAPWAKTGYRPVREFPGEDRVLFLYRSRTDTYLVLPSSGISVPREHGAPLTDLTEVRDLWAKAVEGTFEEVLAWTCRAWDYYSGFVGQPLLDHQSRVLNPAAFTLDDSLATLAREMLLATGRERAVDSEDLNVLVPHVLHVVPHSRLACRIKAATLAHLTVWAAGEPDDRFFPENLEQACLDSFWVACAFLEKTWPGMVRDHDDPADALRMDFDR